MRSPNYGLIRHVSRDCAPPRGLFVTGVHLCGAHLDHLVLVTVQEPGGEEIMVPARDHGHAVSLVDLLKQGCFAAELRRARAVA